MTQARTQAPFCAPRPKTIITSIWLWASLSALGCRPNTAIDQLPDRKDPVRAEPVAPILKAEALPWIGTIVVPQAWLREERRSTSSGEVRLVAGERVLVRAEDRKWLEVQVILPDLGVFSGYLLSSEVGHLASKPQRVDFERRPGDGKIRISTIEDFIALTQFLERQYSTASNKQIAGELRQLWYNGPAWDGLLNSRGILNEQGFEVDIERSDNIVAMTFALDTLTTRHPAPLHTPLGDVSIGHVMSGIDAALNGAPNAPLRQGVGSIRNAHNAAISQAVHDASKDHILEFATWACDLGQAYGDYIYANNTSKDRPRFPWNEISTDQLLGDIHGYIAIDLTCARNCATNECSGASCDKMAISEILGRLYGTHQAPGANPDTVARAFLARSKLDSDEFGKFHNDDVVSCASLQFAKSSFKHLSSEPPLIQIAEGGVLIATGALQDVNNDFGELSDHNEEEGPPETRISALLEALRSLVTGSCYAVGSDRSNSKGGLTHEYSFMVNHWMPDLEARYDGQSFLFQCPAGTAIDRFLAGE